MMYQKPMFYGSVLIQATAQLCISEILVPMQGVDKGTIRLLEASVSIQSSVNAAPGELQMINCTIQPMFPGVNGKALSPDYLQLDAQVTVGGGVSPYFSMCTFNSNDRWQGAMDFTFNVAVSQYLFQVTSFGSIDNTLVDMLYVLCFGFTTDLSLKNDGPSGGIQSKELSPKQSKYDFRH